MFSLTKSGTFTTLVTFDNLTGGELNGGLVADAAGTLYGTTTASGQRGGGSVFSITGSGFVPKSTGTVPEPASWAMLIVGFGLVGAVMRRRLVAAAG